MKSSITLLFLCFSFYSFGQVRCADIVLRFEPKPQLVFNDSVKTLFDNGQIAKLIDEQNLIFSFKYDLKVNEITQLQMDYFFEQEFAGDLEPLDQQIIESLESFFKRNIKLVIKDDYPKEKSTDIVECSFVVHVENK